MSTIVDPRSFEHPYIGIGHMCFLFQLRLNSLTKHLAEIGLEPARSLNGEFFSPRPDSKLYAASDVLLALPPPAQRVFLAWQRGDLIFPANTQYTDDPPPFSALRDAPVGPRGGRPF
ncbi:MAG: hypothetical protein H0X39_03950 [Actinobacteria bacterium]|nr:hypothetical protein [Actinomycetota bacterium]